MISVELKDLTVKAGPFLKATTGARSVEKPDPTILMSSLPNLLKVVIGPTLSTESSTSTGDAVLKS
jgi:hypothetical protein